ncbi:MAG: tRNA (N(6)-L-threonylcarbamoyladenosine(37)-C(2))-methylthiotransferase MtaB [Bacteroidales bacterium]|nr:tRNA (N(6)-L-threonylcarbamoyladenosine(37)-C(2))-methylthiotransferase MtaB [Bacteroidales bacterium]
MSDRQLKVAFHTLGCKLNFSETSALSRKLESSGFRNVSFDEDADIYVIHGCTVTEAADRKCRQAIKKTIRRSPGSFIVVAGCYAQLKHEEIARIQGVDLVLGTNEKYDILEYLKDIKKRPQAEIHYCEKDELHLFHPSFSGDRRTRSFLKVQDGCDYACSYCTIPQARGRSRNQAVRACVEDAEKIAAKGIKEIVLTGVNTGDFGKSTGETFMELLEGLTAADGIERFRMSSVEPNLLTDEIIALVSASNKIMPHFHIPLQSGSDKILAKMRRRYTRELFASRVRKIREMIPLAGIGADVIVGFPGESEEDYRESRDFIKSLDLSYLHVFSYSGRKGTPAAGMPGQVDNGMKHRRSKDLQLLSEKKRRAFNKRCIGMKADILWESEDKPGFIAGFTGNYIRVLTHYDPELKGKIRAHILKESDENGNFIV